MVVQVPEFDTGNRGAGSPDVLGVEIKIFIAPKKACFLVVFIDQFAAKDKLWTYLGNGLGPLVVLYNSDLDFPVRVYQLNAIGVDRKLHYLFFVQIIKVP